MRSILSTMAVISALGFGYYFDDIARGSTAAVVQMGDELKSVYSFFTTDVREEGRNCVRHTVETSDPISDHCREMVNEWRAQYGDGEVMRDTLAIGIAGVAKQLSN